MPHSNRTPHVNLTIEDSAVSRPTRVTPASALTYTKDATLVQATTLTFAADTVAITDTGGANGGYGSQKLCDLPSQHVYVLGCTVNLAVTAAAGIGATAALDYSVGTAAEATDSTLDSTQANILAKVDAPLTGSAATLTDGMAAGVTVDGTGGSAALYVNFGVPDADITATSSLSVTGTVKLTYLELGGY